MHLPKNVFTTTKSPRPSRRVAQLVRTITFTAPLLSFCNWWGWAQPNTLQQRWSPWRGDAAFSNIEVRVTCSGYNQFAGLYRWDIEIRNAYAQAVNVGWEVEPESRDRQGRKRRGISPALAAGGVEETFELLPKPCGTEIQLRIVDVTEPERVPQQGTDPTSAITNTNSSLSQGPSSSVATIPPLEPEPPSGQPASNGQTPLFKQAVQPVPGRQNPAAAVLPQRTTAPPLPGSIGPPALMRSTGDSDQGPRPIDTGISARSGNIGSPRQLVCPDWSSKFNEITSPFVRALVEHDKKEGYAQIVGSIGVEAFMRNTEKMIYDTRVAVERYSKRLMQLSNPPSQSDCGADGRPETELRCAYYLLQQYLLALEGSIDIAGRCQTTSMSP
jgi:hypothetical protein